MVKVSVIMPSLNVAAYISECVESAINQTISEIEIICIDAGSTDGTWEILQSYAKKDSRMVLLHSEVKSYGYQVNMGINVASGQYIAILETDDYIQTNMYERLYKIAVKEDLDYIKADYRKFFELNNKERIFTPMRQFKDSQLYNKCLDPHNVDDIYKADHNIWRGIYKKQFILENNITLNETKGAAYQDIGFQIQLFAHADRCMYIDDCLYFYRTDRETASTYSDKGLRNTYIEFKRFYEKLSSEIEDIYLKGFYIYLAIAFLGEYEKTLIKADCNPENPICADYYPWFKSIITKAICEKIINENDFEHIRYERMLSLFMNDAEFAVKVKEECLQKEEYFLKLDNLWNQRIVIFGAGHWGYEVLKYVSEHNLCEVLAFADNDRDKWKKNIAGVKVISLEEAIKEYKDVYFIIANEYHSQEMQKQYISLNGNEGKLINLFS